MLERQRKLRALSNDELANQAVEEFLIHGLGRDIVDEMVRRLRGLPKMPGDAT